MQPVGDLAAVAAAIGDAARARMLLALLGGRALPAGELARVGEVTPATASAHLARLVGAGLVVVERSGRHRYHRLADERVALAVEALNAVASPPRSSTLRGSSRAAAERAARSCYDHLAGGLGVAVADRLGALGVLEPSSLALLDPAPLRALGLAPEALAPAGRRPLTRPCLDWSEHRHHLAGSLGAALLGHLLGSGWVVRRGSGRALGVTPAGRRALLDGLGLDVAGRAPAALLPAP